MTNSAKVTPKSTVLFGRDTCWQLVNHLDTCVAILKVVLYDMYVGSEISNLIMCRISCYDELLADSVSASGKQTRRGSSGKHLTMPHLILTGCVDAWALVTWLDSWLLSI